MFRGKRSRIFGVCTMVALAAACLWQLRSGARNRAELRDVIFGSPAGMPTHLYPVKTSGAGTNLVPSANKSYDVLGDDGVTPAKSFVVNADGSSKDVTYGRDGETPTASRGYYAPVAPEEGRRPLNDITYTADGKASKTEAWYRLNGTREKAGARLANGDWQEYTFFADGRTTATEKTERAAEPTGYVLKPAPVLIAEHRWLNDAKHSLVYADELNEDGSRDAQEYDDKLNLILIRHVGKEFGPDTYVKAYYPGTKQLRLEGYHKPAEPGSYETALIDGRLYDRNGKLTCKYVVHAGAVHATYFDASGRRPVFEQYWAEIGTGQPDGSIVNHWDLMSITEFGADSRPTRLLYPSENGLVRSEQRLNVTINGVKEDRVIYDYRDDGTLQQVAIVRNGDRVILEKHTSAENVRVKFSADEMRPFEPHPEFPVPPSFQGP